MKHLYTVALLVVLTLPVLGQEDALVKSIFVAPGPVLDVYVPPGTLTGWNLKSNWAIVAIDANMAVGQVRIERFDTDDDKTMFTIVPDAASAKLIASAAQVVVNFGSTVVAVKGPAPKPKPESPGQQQGGSTPPPIAKAKNKDSSDIYVSGTYSPGFKGKDPQYSIDASVAVMFDLKREKPNHGQLGFVGSVKSDKRKNMNPDSYRLFLAYQNVAKAGWWGPGDSIQGAQFTMLAGAEFDRKADNVNFIAAPYLDFPIRIYPDRVNNRTTPLLVVTPTIGFETGRNFKNLLQPEGSGAIFRGVAGATVLFRFNPKVPGFAGVEITNSYLLRAPAVKEVYTLTKKVDGEDVDDPFLNRKPRHYVKSELTFKLNDYVGFTTKYEYGMLPPAFRLVDHKLTFGLSFSAIQNWSGIPGTIRNK